MLCCAVHATWRFENSSHIVGRNKRLKTRTNRQFINCGDKSDKCKTAAKPHPEYRVQWLGAPLPGGLSATRGWGGGGRNADAFGHVYFLITKARRTISPTTTTATATKDGFNVNYAMLPLPLTLTLPLPQGSRQRDTRWQFAFTYCPPFPMRCPCLALTTKFACHVAKFRRAKKVKSAAWKVGKRWRCQQMLRQPAAVRECGSQRSAVVSLGQTHENELKRATRRQRNRKRDGWVRQRQIAQHLMRLSRRSFLNPKQGNCVANEDEPSR